jgi:hypothetical protein
VTGPRIPAPRPSLDDELQAERATAAAHTLADRMAHDGLMSGLAAIQRLMEEAR